MEKKQWTMQEDFIFPEHAGVPAGAELLEVTPRYTEQRTEDAVRLTGIYHIAANVVFDEGERLAEYLDSAILIDDVELEAGSGYFEYAVPLHIDLPPEVGSPLHVATTATMSELDGQGSFGVVWDVECSYGEEIAQVEEAVAIVEVEESEVAEAAVEIEEVVAVAEVEEMEETVAVAQVEEAVAVVKTENTVAVASPMATYDSTSYVDTDEALSFIAGLEDGISTTTFRSNDIFIKNES